MTDYNKVASDEAIQAAAAALTANGIQVSVADDSEAAKQAVLAMIPKGAEVFTVTSKTTEALDLDKEINESGNYDAVRPKFYALMSDPGKRREARKLGAAPDYVVGSVQGVTEDGRVLLVSNTGSQLPGYLYGAGRVIWIVGAQKITKDIEAAQKRLTEHVVPLEDERAQAAYGIHTNISKMVFFNKEVNPERVHMIIVKEALGF